MKAIQDWRKKLEKGTYDWLANQDLKKQRTYGNYDISDKNFIRLLKIAKNKEEITKELNLPQVTEETKGKIDEAILTEKTKILGSLVSHHVFEDFLSEEGNLRKNHSQFFNFTSLFLFAFIVIRIFRLANPVAVANMGGDVVWGFISDALNGLIGISYILEAFQLNLYFKKHQKAHLEVDKKIITALMFEFRQLINLHIYGHVLQKQLNVIVANGLEEGFDAAFEVDTPARKYTEALISKMTRGSIGIAGPRGTGKTTLLHASEGFSNSGQKRIFIQISAPVVYEARDFILYLYSAICNAIIQKLDLSQKDKPKANYLTHFNSILMGFPFWLILLILMAAGVYLLSLIGKILFPNQNVVILNSPINVLPEGLFLLAGVGIVFLVPLITRLIVASLSNIWQIPYSDEDRKLLHIAYSELQKIRYQQTLSSNVTGKVSLTVFETGVDKGSSMQEYPMSLPEVTFSYRDFITQLSERFQFIIAIDELDKIENPVQAQSFLNDLKNILAINNCFYLVSVSQNAMSNFELRGLPFRDAFDSTFDEVVNVNYLNFHAAGAIIDRRLIGVPDPFIELAFALSGGLPRDLIRVMRKMVMENINKGGNLNIEQMANYLLRDDLNRKLDAARFQIQENSWAFLAQTALTQIDNLQDDFSSPRIKETGEWFITQSQINQEWQLKDVYKLKLMAYELGLYMLYIATLYEFFVMDRPLKGYYNVVKPKVLLHGAKMNNFNKSYIDMLVTARQKMGLNGEYALLLMRSFRERYKMQPIAV